MQITPEQYGELCDLFQQAFARIERPDLDPERFHYTSDVARDYANAAMRALGFERPPLTDDPEALKRFAAYLNARDEEE